VSDFHDPPQEIMIPHEIQFSMTLGPNARMQAAFVRHTSRTMIAHNWQTMNVLIPEFLVEQCGYGSRSGMFKNRLRPDRKQEIAGGDEESRR